MQRSSHFGPLLLPLINRAVEDLVWKRSLVYEVPGEVPFHELGRAAKQPNHSSSRQIGCRAGSIGILEVKPARETGMAQGHTVTGVSRRRDV